MKKLDAVVATTLTAGVVLFLWWKSSRRSQKFKKNLKNEKAWAFYESLGSPKHICAPMVLGSELPFRMLVRKHGADLCYGPMVRARRIIEAKDRLEREYRFCKEDRPLVVQLCGNNPEEIVKAALIVEPFCDAIDINLGCPQDGAKKEFFGAFLLEHPNIITAMIRALVSSLKIPVFCKIRILPFLDETMKLCHEIEEAGCSLLAVHGRVCGAKRDGLANLEWIKVIREHLGIPVISNGNCRNYAELQKGLDITGCPGVMSACGLLENPRIFNKQPKANVYELCDEYLDFVEQYPPPFTRAINLHMRYLLRPILNEQIDIRDMFRNHLKVNNVWQMRQLIRVLRSRDGETVGELKSLKAIKMNWQDESKLEGFDEGGALLFGSDSSESEDESDS